MSVRYSRSVTGTCASRSAVKKLRNMFLDVAPAAAGVKPPPASPKPDPAILGRRGGTAEDAERKPRFPPQPLHPPPAFPEKPAQAEIVLRQVSHGAFGHLVDDHVRPRPLDVTPIEIVRPYELDLPGGLGEHGGQGLDALRRERISKDQNLFVSDRWISILEGDMRAAKCRRSTGQPLQILRNRIAVITGGVLCKIVELEPFAERRIKLCAQIEYGVIIDVLARKHIEIGIEADPLAQKLVAQKRPFGVPMRISLAV